MAMLGFFCTDRTWPSEGHLNGTCIEVGMKLVILIGKIAVELGLGGADLCVQKVVCSCWCNMAAGSFTSSC
jgi:hypothetical protein